jgi:hypothetical protein
VSGSFPDALEIKGKGETRREDSGQKTPVRQTDRHSLMSGNMEIERSSSFLYNTFVVEKKDSKLQTFVFLCLHDGSRV